MVTRTIKIDRDMLERLRSAHAAATGPLVVVDGHEFDVRYLGYLIEYAAARLGVEAPVRKVH